jgi:hypothetical protein
MGTVVTGFAAGVLAGALLVACGGGEGAGPGRVLVCAAGDRDCQRAAALGADRACWLMPAALLVYMGREVNDAMLRADLEERGYWRRDGTEWLEGEDCE